MTNRSYTILNIILSLLVITAALFGIWGNIYRDHPWAACQLIGQDAVTLLISVLFFISLFVKHSKIIFVRTGLLGYIIYTYVTFTFGPALNEMFLVYVAILSLSIFSFIFSFNELLQLRIDTVKNVWFTISGIYLIVIALMLALLWLGDIYGNLNGQPMLANPTGEPFLEVYALDLGFVIPAFIVGSVLMMRKKGLGYIITAVMLIKSTTMGFALIGMTIALYFYGYGLEMFLVYLWGTIGIAGLLLTLKFIGKLSLSGKQQRDPIEL